MNAMNQFWILFNIILFILPQNIWGGWLNPHGSWYNPKSYLCTAIECCDHHGIPAKFVELEKRLRSHVYGQHLAIDIVVNALKSHWDPKHEPKKSLTLSFHGMPGGGKNYITKFITESLYQLGSKSKWVHHYIGRIDFPKEELVPEYQIKLFKDITEAIRQCERQLFIFDEVDKMPPSLLDIIKPLLDYRDNVEGINCRQAIFIFLSNTGANLINNHVIDLWKKGRKREDLRISDFEKLLSIGAFNEKGGFYMADNIKHNLIDFYIPFLPMELHHIKMCVKDEFNARNYTPSENEIMEAMEFIDWGPEPEKIYSKTGCKRISQKVGMIVTKSTKKHDEL